MGIIWGSIVGDIKGASRSLEDNSCKGKGLLYGSYYAGAICDYARFRLPKNSGPLTGGPNNQ